MTLHMASVSIAALYCLLMIEVAEAVFFKQRWRDVEVAETAAAFPSSCLGDAAWIFTVNDLLQTRDDVRVAVLAEFDHDPAATHLVRDSSSGARASEGI